jgi:hypothetical protein
MLLKSGWYNSMKSCLLGISCENTGQLAKMNELQFHALSRSLMSHSSQLLNMEFNCDLGRPFNADAALLQQDLSKVADMQAV